MTVRQPCLFIGFLALQITSPLRRLLLGQLTIALAAYASITLWTICWRPLRHMREGANHS